MNLVQIKKNSERKQVINAMYFKQFSNKILTTSTFKLSLKFLLNYITRNCTELPTPYSKRIEYNLFFLILAIYSLLTDK